MRRIFYIVMILSLVYLNAMYDWEEGRWFLAIVLAAPIVEFCFLLIMLRKTYVEFSVSPGKEIVTKGDEIFLEWKIKGPFRKCLENIKVQWRESVSFQKKKGRKKILKARHGQKGKLSVMTQWSGYLKLEVCNYSFTGPIGLIRVWKKGKVQEKIPVLPKQHPVLIEGKIEKENPVFESNEYSKIKSGDDPAEIFGVRPYQYGDKISRIHWKMTARQDELYVKEFSLPISASMVLLLEKDREVKTGQAADAFYTLVSSIARAILDLGNPFYVAWNSKKDGMKRFLVSDEESYYTMLFVFLEEELYFLSADSRNAWRSMYPNEEYHFLILTEGLKLKMEGKKTIQFEQDSLDEKLEGWVLEVS